MTNEIKPFEAEKISRNPLDDVKVGDWYWVKVTDYGPKGKKKIVERLMCVEEIGSNYVGFTVSNKHGSSGANVHFDEFLAECRSEPNWREVLQKKMNQLQGQIQEKTKELVEAGQKLYLLPQLAKPVEPKPEEQGSLLPMKVADEPKRYKKELQEFDKKTLPAISESIKELAEEFAVTAKDMALPDLVKLEAVKKKLEVVEDRIFTIELYCGLQESVHQIAEGDPAPASEKIAIRQALLYMDEETLFDYQDGGMDFKKIGDFDKWVVKPENMARVLPEPKAVVAFRVRRHKKEYDRPETLLQAWTQIGWDDANQQTYLLIRNGQNVYRIASEIDFSPRLIPMKNEIGEAQFKVIDQRYNWDKHEDEVVSEKLITPDHIEYDDHVKQLDAILKQYNRIVILIQGLLDRSHVFHPHPPVRLTVPGVLDTWVRLIRDEELGLPSNRVTFEEYQKQLNSTLRKGKWVYVDSKYNEKYANGETPYREGSRWREPTPRRGWAVNEMPHVVQVENMKRDGSAVRVSWPWGECATVEHFVESKDRPGWGHYERKDTGRMCHEWVPTSRVLNVSDYHAGDYKMFLCDRTLRGEYLKWAQYLLVAEDWTRRRANGMKPEDDPKAKIYKRWG